MGFLTTLFGAVAPYRYLILAVAVFLAGFALEAKLKNAEIADIQRAHAEEKAKDATQALEQLKTATQAMHEAAASAQSDNSNLSAKLDKIAKEFRNAKKPVLPADCRIDDVRLRNLTDAAKAVNESALRLRSSTTLQADPSP